MSLIPVWEDSTWESNLTPYITIELKLQRAEPQPETLGSGHNSILVKKLNELRFFFCGVDGGGGVAEYGYPAISASLLKDHPFSKELL